jgi:hypothetical protein
MLATPSAAKSSTTLPDNEVSMPLQLALLTFLFAGLVFGQNAGLPAAIQAETQNGLPTPWDAQRLLAELDAQNQQFKPLLQRMDPQQWMDEKGAPSTYISQWNRAQQQLQDSALVVNRLSAQPESVALCLDAYFRMEALESTERSLLEGVRNYGGRPLAEQLEQLIARNFNDRERFRKFLVDLATNKEQMFRIADEEAQRCRGMLSKEVPDTKKKTKAKQP